MIKTHKFDCGCEFPIIQEKPLRLKVDLDIDKISLECPEVWRLLKEDKLCGIFQLDSNHSEHICHQFKPSSIEELAIVVAISRPGAIEGIYNGKSIKDRVIDRKNLEEDNEPINEALSDILMPTYQMMVFQEQSTKIVQKLAGFILEEAELMRKAIGKKKADLMHELESKFIDGCKKVNIVNEEIAKELFEMIRASQRYQFNLSHAVLYALNSYQTAYCKAHFPKEFFTSWLSYHKDKEDIFKLVQNAKLIDIDVVTPDLRLLNKDFQIHKDKIYFGILHIKGVGEAIIRDLEYIIGDTEKEIGDVKSWSWLDFLVYVSQNINSVGVKGLICTGALDYFNVGRYRMLYEYAQFCNLKDREIKWIKEKVKTNRNVTLIDLIDELILIPTGTKGCGCSSKKRLETIKNIREVLINPPFSLKDSSEWIGGVENEYIGVSITCTKVEDCDIEDANCDCHTFLKGKNNPGPILIACKIDSVKEITTKTKQKMAFMSVSDITGCIDSVVIFSKEWENFSQLLVEENTIIISGQRGNKDKNSLVLEKVWQI